MQTLEGVADVIDDVGDAVMEITDTVDDSGMISEPEM